MSIILLLFYCLLVELQMPIFLGMMASAAGLVSEEVKSEGYYMGEGRSTYTFTVCASVISFI